jgi:hypothetical protein
MKVVTKHSLVNFKCGILFYFSSFLLKALQSMHAKFNHNIYFQENRHIYIVENHPFFRRKPAKISEIVTLAPGSLPPARTSSRPARSSSAAVTSRRRGSSLPPRSSTWWVPKGIFYYSRSREFDFRQFSAISGNFQQFFDIFFTIF